MSTSYKTLDLFAGAGGMALGFAAVGARCIAAVERDQAAADTFATALRHADPLVCGGAERGDVNNMSVEELAAQLPEAPDIIIGGPPCQGFSRVGRAKNSSLLEQEDRHRVEVRDSHRNLLYRYFLGAVQHMRPRAFVMENVPGMREMRGVDVAHRIAREASHHGYNVRYFLLNAAWYGVPQNRWRIFFVGLRSDLGPMAIPTPPPRLHTALTPLPEGVGIPNDPWMLWGDNIPTVPQASPPVTVLEALGDLPRLREHLKGVRPVEQRLGLAREPSPWAAELRRWPELEAQSTVSGNWHRFTPRDYPIFRDMAHGDRYPDALAIAHRHLRTRVAELELRGELPEDATARSEVLQELEARIIPPYRNDAFADKWRKLNPDEPSWTVTAHLSKDTYSHIHYHSAQARTITVREAARLQSFPDGLDFSGSFGDAFRQIGNAVPPLLARALASHLLEQLRELESKGTTRYSGSSSISLAPGIKHTPSELSP